MLTVRPVTSTVTAGQLTKDTTADTLMGVRFTTDELRWIRSSMDEIFT